MRVCCNIQLSKVLSLSLLIFNFIPSPFAINLWVFNLTQIWLILYWVIEPCYSHIRHQLLRSSLFGDCDPLVGYLSSRDETIEAISVILSIRSIYICQSCFNQLYTCNQELDRCILIASPFLILSALVCSYAHQELHDEILASSCSCFEIAGPKVPCLVW